MDGSIEDVQAWRKNHKLPRRGVKRVGDGSMQDQLLAAQITKVEEEARHKRMKNDELAGKLYNADDVERDVAELTSYIRCRLEDIPDELSMEFPENIRWQLTLRLKDRIALILTKMSQFRLSSDTTPVEIESADSEAESESSEQTAV